VAQPLLPSGEARERLSSDVEAPAPPHDASVHDSQKLEDVLDRSNTASDVWADSAYRSTEIEEKLAERGLKSRIHRRTYRNRKLSEPIRRARRCALASSMCSAIKRTAWEPRSCAPSV